MGTRKRLLGSAWIFMLSGVALAALTACGDDEDDGDSGSTGGKASGGSTSTGGRSGSSRWSGRS